MQLALEIFNTHKMPIHGGGDDYPYFLLDNSPMGTPYLYKSHSLKITYIWLSYFLSIIIFVLHPHIHTIEKKGAGAGDNLMGRKKG